MLYKAASGIVFIDDTNILELDWETIRSNIAVVSQSPYIFNLSIRDNLRIVKPDLSEEEMRRVCKAACIYEDIMNMPEGYDSTSPKAGRIASICPRDRPQSFASRIQFSPTI